MEEGEKVGEEERLGEWNKGKEWEGERRGRKVGRQVRE